MLTLVLPEPSEPSRSVKQTKWLNQPVLQFIHVLSTVFLFQALLSFEDQIQRNLNIFGHQAHWTVYFNCLPQFLPVNYQYVM